MNVSRRRIAILLLLTCLLLIALDRGTSSLGNKVRDAFSVVIHPFETAAKVVARPVERLWDGITSADELRLTNAALKDQLDYQRGATVEAMAAHLEYSELAAITRLASAGHYPIVNARVVGESAGNFQATVEINVGSEDGVQVGMPVTDGAGLVGRIRSVRQNSSTVLLAVDPNYSIGAEVLMNAAEVASVEQDTSNLPTDDTVAPSGDPLSTDPFAAGPQSETPNSTTTSTTSTTTPPTQPPDRAPGDTSPTTPDSTTTTTTTEVPLVLRETGLLTGQGPGRPLLLQLLDNSATALRVSVGAVVKTAGGQRSIAPPGLPIGVVRSVTPASAGGAPVVEITPNARLSNITFVAVVLYLPNSSVGG